MPRLKKKDFSLFIRNFVFGVEDSLVSTVGLLSGVAAAGVVKQTVFLTGMVLIFVEALSMATGSFLSEESAQEYENQKAMPKQKSFFAALTMFLSYFIAGFIPLLPYLFLEKTQAFYFSIIASLIALFLLGIVSGIFDHGKLLKKGIEMLILGGITIVAGIIVGNIATKL